MHTRDDAAPGAPQLLEDGTIRVPMRVEDEASGLIGDGVVTIDATHPDYPAWLAFITKDEATKSR